MAEVLKIEAPKQKKRFLRTYRVRMIYDDYPVELILRDQSVERVRERIRRTIGIDVEPDKIRQTYFYFSQRPNLATVSRLTMALRAYLRSGVTPGQALRRLLITYDNAFIIDGIMTAIDILENEGKPLWYALSRTNLYDPIIVEYIRLGDETGNLESILEDVARELNFRHKIMMTIRQALVYPFLLLFMGMGAMTIFRKLLYPVLIQMYRDFQIEVPFFMDALRAIIDTTPWFFGGLILTYPLWKRPVKAYYKSRRYNIHKFLSRIPVIGRMFVNYAVARVAKSIYVSTRVGQTSTERYSMLSRVTPYEPFRRVFERVFKTLVGDVPPELIDQTPAKIMRSSEDFAYDLAGMIELADNTGDESIYETVAEQRLFELEQDQQLLSQLIEIIMYIIIGVMVLGILLMFYYPYTEIFTRLG